MTIDIDPILGRIGPFTLGWEGIFIGVALLASLLVAARDTRLARLDPELVYGAAVWVIPFGFIGGRVFHVMDAWNYYAVHPLDIISVGRGGSEIYGAIIFGSAVALAFAVKRHVAVGRFFDACTPGLTLGLAIGRIGGLLTGAELGRPASLPISIRYTNPSSFATSALAVYPAAAFDLIWALALYLLLVRLRRSRLPDGSIYWTFSTVYAVGQVWIGFFRVEPADAFGFGQTQLIGVLVLTVSVIILAALVARTFRPKSPSGPTLPRPSWPIHEGRHG